MKALILNSGLGSRMGVLTKEHPKCMTDVGAQRDSILSRQLKAIVKAGITDVVMTTGYYDEVLIEYCNSLNLPLNYTFVKNPIYDKTNYIYSIYCAREALRDSDVVLMHGDLIFEQGILNDLLKQNSSAMTVSTTLPLPEKDFKAVVDGDKILKVGIEFFDSAYAAQPLYKLTKEAWGLWLDKIIEYCESGEEKKRKCYAENAFNEISDVCEIKTFDFGDLLCAEIDNSEDLEVVSAKVTEIEKTEE